MNDDTTIPVTRANIKAGTAALDDARTDITNMLNSGGHTAVEERRLANIRHELSEAVKRADAALEGLGWFDKPYPDERGA